MLLYRHLKPNGETFYIGVGNNIRPYTKSDRNNFWWKVVKKYGYEIQILKRNLTKEEAYELEVILISWYGRRDLGLGYLVNLTDGGDGSNNVVVSEETRDKIRQKAIGRKLSDESKSKISKLVLHLEMGIFFTSITEASELLNIPLWSFGKQIRNETPNKTGCIIV